VSSNRKAHPVMVARCQEHREFIAGQKDGGKKAFYHWRTSDELRFELAQTLVAAKIARQANSEIDSRCDGPRDEQKGKLIFAGGRD
jgi:hypothetical protein